MRLLATGLTLTTLTLTACMLPIPMIGAGGIGTNPEEARAANASLMQAQESAASQASRPGDASMDCAAIQTELMAQMKDPKFQAAMSSMGARAQGQKARQDAAMAGGKQVAPTEADTRAPLDTTADLVTMMPQIMRGQKLNELATAKKCAFLKPPMPS